MVMERVPSKIKLEGGGAERERCPVKTVNRDTEPAEIMRICDGTLLGLRPLENSMSSFIYGLHKSKQGEI